MKEFLYNKDNPSESYDLFSNTNPKDTIPIKYKNLTDVEETISKLEKLYKNKKYEHKRITQVAMIMYVRLRLLKDKKHKEYLLSQRYFEFLKKRTKLSENERRKIIFSKNNF